jgi:hypothetical protein
VPPLCPLALAGALVLSLGAGPSAPRKLRPFTTDGCSLFPDRDPLGRADWRACCVAHDVAYWRGGTARERRDADLALRACVARLTGDARLAETMYLGVRGGGLPAFPTWYRWGYGWDYGRMYQPLTAEERSRVEAELTRWRAAGGPDARAIAPAATR